MQHNIIMSSSKDNVIIGDDDSSMSSDCSFLFSSKSNSKDKKPATKKKSNSDRNGKNDKISKPSTRMSTRMSKRSGTSKSKSNENDDQDDDQDDDQKKGKYSNSSSSSDDDDDDDAFQFKTKRFRGNTANARKRLKPSSKTYDVYSDDEDDDDDDNDDNSDEDEEENNNLTNKMNSVGNRLAKLAQKRKQKQTKKTSFDLDDDDDDDDDDDIEIIQNVIQSKATTTNFTKKMSNTPNQSITTKTTKTNTNPIILDLDSDDDNILDTSFSPSAKAVLDKAKKAREQLEKARIATIDDMDDDYDDYGNDSEIEVYDSHYSGPISSTISTGAGAAVTCSEPVTGSFIQITLRTNVKSAPSSFNKKELQGKTNNIRLRTGSKAQALMDKYHTFHPISRHSSVKLTFDGQVMDMNKTLANYELEDEDLVDVVLEIPSDAESKLKNQGSTSGSSFKIGDVASVKIITRTKGGNPDDSHTYILKSNDPFEKLVNAYRKQHRYSSIKPVFLEHDGVRISDLQQSPFDLNMGNECLIEICDETQRMKERSKVSGPNNYVTPSHGTFASAARIQIDSSPSPPPQTNVVERGEVSLNHSSISRQVSNPLPGPPSSSSGTNNSIEVASTRTTSQSTVATAKEIIFVHILRNNVSKSY